MKRYKVFNTLYSCLDTYVDNRYKVFRFTKYPLGGNSAFTYVKYPYFVIPKGEVLFLFTHPYYTEHLSFRFMKDDRTPNTYFVSKDKDRDIRMADSRDILESILQGDYTSTKGLVANSILQRLEQQEVLQVRRREGGTDISNHIFGE